MKYYRITQNLSTLALTCVKCYNLSRMRTSVALAILVIFALSLTAGGVYYLYQKKDFTPQTIFNKSSSPTPTPIAKFPTTSPTPTPKVQPESGFNSANIQLGIKVQRPMDNDTISSPLKVNGIANAESQQITIQIKDASGQVLGQGSATACLDVHPCPFEASVIFQNPATNLGTIEASSGNFLRTVPVKF